MYNKKAHNIFLVRKYVLPTFESLNSFNYSFLCFMKNLMLNQALLQNHYASFRILVKIYVI